MYKEALNYLQNFFKFIYFFATQAIQPALSYVAAVKSNDGEPGKPQRQHTRRAVLDTDYRCRIGYF